MKFKIRCYQKDWFALTKARKAIDWLAGESLEQLHPLGFTDWNCTIIEPYFAESGRVVNQR